MSPKYKIFCSKKLHTTRIQHYLHHGIFLNFLKDLNSNFWSFKFWTHKARAPNVRSRNKEPTRNFSFPLSANPKDRKIFLDWGNALWLTQLRMPKDRKIFLDRWMNIEYSYVQPKFFIQFFYILKYTKNALLGVIGTPWIALILMEKNSAVFRVLWAPCKLLDSWSCGVAVAAICYCLHAQLPYFVTLYQKNGLPPHRSGAGYVSSPGETIHSWSAYVPSQRRSLKMLGSDTNIDATWLYPSTQPMDHIVHAIGRSMWHVCT
jgi:hypothetical protein